MVLDEQKKPRKTLEYFDTSSGEGAEKEKFVFTAPLFVFITLLDCLPHLIFNHVTNFP